jgi:hypothetical protein
VAGAVSDKNGRANTAAVIATYGTTGILAVQFCYNIGPGWYLPAYEELINMSAAGTDGYWPPLNGLAGAKLLPYAAADDFIWSSTDTYGSVGRVTYTEANAKDIVYAVRYDGMLDARPRTKNQSVRCAWRN